MATNKNDSIPFLLHDIARGSRYRFDARARSLGITRAQWRVLLLLARIDGPTQSEIAELLDVERITLCRMVDRLADAELVERRADPSDRRVWRLHLTERAAPLVDRLNTIASDMEQEILAPLSAQEQAMLSGLLVRMRDRIRDLDEHATPPKASGDAR